MAKLLIGGEFVDSEGGEIYDVRNPADTREVVGTAVRATREDVRRAADSAEAAFEKWSEESPAVRGRVLRTVANLVRENEKQIAALITKENGKPLADAIGEARGFAATMDYYSGLWPALRGGHVPMADTTKFAIVMRKPVGACVAILPWNNPILQVAGKLAPALLAGNSMIIKPASTTPLSIAIVAELLQKAGLPPGVVNVVTGAGATVGEELVRNPKIAKVSFTGDTETGKRIMALASNDVKRVTLELGGSDPMIVCDDADLGLAVDGAALGRFRNTGQGCLCVKRLFLFEGIADEFMKRLTEKVSRIVVGDGMKPDVKMGPCHTSRQRELVEGQVADAVDRGAEVVTGGSRPSGPDYEFGHFYKPTILADVDYSCRIAKEECFGPALPVFVVKDLDEAIAKANDTIYGLSSYIFTRDMNRAIKAAQKIRAGRTLVNSALSTSVELPHGGVKQSGLGREVGLEVFDYYTEPKGVVFDTSTQRTPWIPD